MSADALALIREIEETHPDMWMSIVSLFELVGTAKLDEAMGYR